MEMNEKCTINERVREVQECCLGIHAEQAFFLLPNTLSPFERIEGFFLLRAFHRYTPCGANLREGGERGRVSNVEEWKLWLGNSDGARRFFYVESENQRETVQSRGRERGGGRVKFDRNNSSTTVNEQNKGKIEDTYADRLHAYKAHT